MTALLKLLMHASLNFTGARTADPGVAGVGAARQQALKGIRRVRLVLRVRSCQLLRWGARQIWVSMWRAF